MSQSTEQFLRVEGIVTAALALPEEERMVLIAQQCGSDRALAQEVFQLLDACAAEDRLTEECRKVPPASVEDSLEDTRIGPYEIDRLLGHGGMGTVYLAHRADGQFEQKVAIKLIDLPLTTDLFRERFRQERQILADLHHPFIARLLDGGVSAEDRLYLVLEYIDGVPVDRFCEQRGLTLNQRIALLLLVCEAVQFAHQNLIVHRDLKPDNILIVDDGTPRLLDFGTAKMLSPSPARQQSDLTCAGYLTFTPRYASPEQILGHPITTASDTYALGVLLYLLLTGTLPYEIKDFTTAEMLRTVCEEPPHKPSLSFDAKPLNQDLKAILMKALRKEPQERYLTAESLAADLRAYLAGRPVAARRGTLRYRASKFVHRHRWGILAATVLLVTLLAGVAGVLWQASVANRERGKAEARSGEMRHLSESLLSELDDAIKQLPGSTKAQKLLVTRVLEHLDRVAADAQGDRSMQLELANAYTRLANLQGDAYDQNLGDPAGALISIDKAIALSTPWIDQGRDREALQMVAYAQLSRARILFGTAPIQQAIASTRLAIADYEHLIELPGSRSGDFSEAATAYSLLGDEQGVVIAQSLNDLAAAKDAYRKSTDLENRALLLDPHAANAAHLLIANQLAIAAIEKVSDPAQAIRDVQSGLQRFSALSAEQRQSLRMIRIRDSLLVDEAVALAQLGKYGEAEAILADSVSAATRRAATDPQDMRALADFAFSYDRTADVYEIAADSALGASPEEQRKNGASALIALTQEHAGLEKILQQNPSQNEWRPVLADVEVRLGTIQYALHRGGNAAELVRNGLVALREAVQKDQDSPEILDMTAQNLLRAQPPALRDPKMAVYCAERAVELSHRRLATYLLTLAQAYRAAGWPEKSRAAAIEGLALLPASLPGSAQPRIRKLLDIQTGKG
jgi:predicted Ser/Thr protein kinase